MSTYSNEHILFLKKRKKEKRLVSFFRLLIVLIFLICWELLARTDSINTFLSSSPSLIFKTIFELFKNGNLLKHIFITLYEVLISFIIAGGLGFIIAVILWRFPFVSKILDPYLTVLNSLPKVALGPLIIIWIGASINSIIFMSLLISTFITIINIYSGFISTDKSYIVLLKSFKANKWQIFRKVILPDNLITIINALKINISMNLIGLLPPVGENFIA